MIANDRLRAGESRSTTFSVMSINVRPTHLAAVSSNVWWWCVSLREVAAD
jgi:hypothetical protein